MKSKKSFIIGISASFGMLCLILDTRTALHGASVGVELCIKTIVPSLFPFFILSILLTGAITGAKLSFLTPIGRLCGIPKGAESILLVGLLGGYPVGAQAIGLAYEAKQLSRSDARRMLGFCNNAGPAFLFGMVGSLFKSSWIAFVLWLIHILSALTVGVLLPGKNVSDVPTSPSQSISLAQAMTRGTRVMAGVCGWVVLFRVLLAFLQRWFLWLLPAAGQVVVSGMLELANGCCELGSLADESTKFLLANLFLSFGGICVGMQTLSVTGQSGLDTGFYFPGKILQTCVSLLLALPMQKALFPSAESNGSFVIMLLIPLIIVAAVLLMAEKKKNNSSIPSQTGV